MVSEAMEVANLAMAVTKVVTMALEKTSTMVLETVVLAVARMVSAKTLATVAARPPAMALEATRVTTMVLEVATLVS